MGPQREYLVPVWKTLYFVRLWISFKNGAKELLMQEHKVATLSFKDDYGGTEWNGLKLE